MALRGTVPRTNSASSAGMSPAVGADVNMSGPEEALLEETCANAIANLLQTPSFPAGIIDSAAVATNSFRAPTARDIPPVTLPNIPQIDPSTLDEYLAEAGSLHAIFRQAAIEDFNDASRNGQRQRASLDRRKESISETPQQRHSRVPSVAGSVDLSSTALNEVVSSRIHPADRAVSVNQQSRSRRRGAPSVAPLSSVPEVYFEPNFHLENPRTFDVVSERAEIVTPLDSTRTNAGDSKSTSSLSAAPGPPNRRILATNAILQEKLSWYMDTIEIHLISAISTASASFFTALGDLRSLHQEAAGSVARIQQLRADLGKTDETVAQDGLRVVRLQQRRSNVRRLRQIVQQVEHLVRDVDECEQSIERGEAESATEKLSSVQTQLDTSSTTAPMSSRLAKITALNGMADLVKSLQSRIGKMYEARLMDSLVQDLRHHVDSVSPSDTIQRWDMGTRRSRNKQMRSTTTTSATHPLISDVQRSNIEVQLKGVARCRTLRLATLSYRDVVWREFKNIIRRHLPSSTEDDLESNLTASTRSSRRGPSQSDKSTILARNLRSLDPVDAEEMLRKTYANVSEALRRLAAQVKVILDITSSFDGENTPQFGQGNDGVQDRYIPLSEQEEIQQTLDMTNLLGQAVDTAQTQIMKILKVRTEQIVSLSLAEFLRYIYINRLFADECEAVSGHTSSSLKDVINGHIKSFLQRASANERQKLVDTLDADKWNVQEINMRNVNTLKDVLDAGSQDDPTWSLDIVSWPPKDSEIDKETRIDISPEAEMSSAVETKSLNLEIDGQKFTLPQPALVALEGVVFFEKMLIGMPSMVTEITTALLDYLKIFNSRSQQLILGAGATRLAGLKNITTKHLALVSQSLSFITALTPAMRQFVQRRMANAQSLMIEFDKLTKLYQEHQLGINDKLVDIMSSRAAVHIATMKKIDWDNAQSNMISGKPSSNTTPSAHMETLIKETTTLYKVLSKLLPKVSVEAIMTPVFSHYQEQWTLAFAQVDVKTAKGANLLMRDANYFKSRFCKIEGGVEVAIAVYDAAARKLQVHLKDAELTESGSKMDVRDDQEPKTATVNGHTE